MWYVTHAMSHMVGWWKFSHNFSSQALTVWDRQCLEDSEQKDDINHDRLNQSVNDKGVYRTALATLVMVNILKAALVTLVQFFLNLNYNVVKKYTTLAFCTQGMVWLSLHCGLHTTPFCSSDKWFQKLGWFWWRDVVPGVPYKCNKFLAEAAPQ